MSHYEDEMRRLDRKEWRIIVNSVIGCIVGVGCICCMLWKLVTS